MPEFTEGGLRIDAQDLSAISPQADDDDRMFHHDGSSSIPMVGGGTTSQRGYYVWDKDAQAWYALFHNADKLDGMQSGEFVHRDGSIAMQGNLDVAHYGLINTDSVSSGTGQLLLNANHAILEASSGGSNVRLKDSNGLLLLDAKEGGDVDAPNGALYEQGSRVATRTWTNNNADVPNADYADEANTLDGYDHSDFLHVSGDQMEGELDLGGFDLKDSGTVKYDSSAGVVLQSALGGPAGSLSAYPLANTDIANSSVTVNAGNQLTGGGNVALGGSITIGLSEGSGSGLDADSVDGAHKSDLDSQYVDAAGDSMSGSLGIGGISTSESNDQAASSHAGKPPVAAPWVYSSAIEADGERGGSSTLIELGANASNTSADEIALITQGNVNLKVGSNNDVHVSNSLYESGNRVATRTWTNSNFYDTSQADSRFLNVSGDSMSGVLDMASNDLVDGTTTVWDTSAGHVPQTQLGGPASSLSAYPLAASDLAEDYALTSRFPLPASDLSEDYALTSRFPIPNSDLSNSTVTVNAGNQLSGGGAVGLGGSITIDLNEGSGSGLDADTVDGDQASDLVHVAGDTMSGNLDLSGNHINGVEKTTFSNSSNDFWRINDGSGGSNTSPHTARFDGRDLRYYAGSGVGTVWRLNQDGSVQYPEGPVTINSETVATQTWVNGNADVPNADYADSAGDANTLDGLDSTQFLRSDTSDTLNATLTVASETKVQFGGSNYFARYDSSRDTLVLGSAENGPVAEVDSAGNLSIEGSLTEGASISS